MEITMADTPKGLARYYKYIEQPPAVERDESEYLLLTIKTLEERKPPIPLRGRFTGAEKAKRHIDDFHLMEERNKAAVANREAKQ
jgi:hypothetical protein